MNIPPSWCEPDPSVVEEQMSLSDAVIGLKAYKEIDQRMALLWHSVDEAIVRPRTDPGASELPNIVVDGVSLSIIDF